MTQPDQTYKKDEKKTYSPNSSEHLKIEHIENEFEDLLRVTIGGHPFNTTYKKYLQSDKK